MAFKCLFFHLVLALSLNYYSIQANLANPTSQSQFFDLMNKYVSGNLISNWKGNSYCNFTESPATLKKTLSKLTSRAGLFRRTRPAKESEAARVVLQSARGRDSRELGNLTELIDLDMSVNKFVGKIPESICRLPKLRVLQLYNNSLVGKFQALLCGSTTLNTLSLYSNFLTGHAPQNLGKSSTMVGVDLSENQLSGRLPDGLCDGGKLNYLLVLQNLFSGEIPESYGNIRYARNLSEMFMQGNRISGVIPAEISLAMNLVKIDLSNNFLSGAIPSEIGNLRRLNLLNLQNNELSSPIPESISLLKFLNVLDLSSNRLTGKIPESLAKLLPNSLNFSNNHLSGEIPFKFIKGEFWRAFRAILNSVFLPISRHHARISRSALTITTEKRWLNKNKEVYENEDTMSPSFFSYDVKSFHRLSFDQREIIDAMVDKNIVGYGGSGTVYKIDLNNGETIAVKKLWSKNVKNSASDDDQLTLDKELKTEVETLGSVRHKNIVKLYCYFSSLDCSLLVYEYMPNGNLWDGLHRGNVFLDWPIRHQIALGVAQGLAYLHHDLMPPIIHRDIKSTNILLDVDYQPKVADFGIAKVLQAIGSKDSTTTVIAGTYGYLAPESRVFVKATTKCDVYSFGVVLMELLTGKKPVEAEFGENKNIIYWVSTKVETKEGAIDVLDKRVGLIV
ncbi:hypothetical protein DH2020_035699 [Rehmannia glutinosa]|uniref:Protein kinase domain-containing protein n=1 Tax=Rehmannia glutinosa TaxID=99300 RepID=A0ABR0V5P5_REHGL